MQSKAQLVKTQEDLKRNEDLFAKKLISDADMAAARLALEVAQANLASAEAQIRRTEGSLNQARDQLTKTMIYSPIDGKVSSLSTEVGERVAGTGSYGGAEVMRVADLANMEVRVNINENDIVNVKLGDKAKIAIDAFPNRKFDAVVKEIGSAARVTGQGTQDEVTNFLVKIRILDKDAPLRPGMSANADVETKTVENVVAVPIQSVTVRAAGGKTAEEVRQAKDKEAKERSGNDLEVVKERQDAKRNVEKLQRVVFVRKGDNVEQRTVETGIADNSYMEIKKGVAKDEEVVAGSYKAISTGLKDGAKVMVQKAGGKEGEKK